MIKKYNGFAAEIPHTAEQLPVGGYVCKIMKAEVQEFSWGQRLAVSIDIAEGEFKDFYANNYRSQQNEDKKWKGVLRVSIPTDDGSEKDEWTKRTFNKFIGVVEDANPGYHFDWDEAKLKGKTVGVLFGNEEWEFNGKTGWSVKPFATATVGDIKDGKDFKIKDKPLSNKSQNSTPAWANDAANANAEELPF